MDQPTAMNIIHIQSESLSNIFLADASKKAQVCFWGPEGLGCTFGNGRHTVMIMLWNFICVQAQ